MDSVDPKVVSGTINGRLDRLPMPRHMWRLLLLIAAGRLFEQYDIYFTAYIAPGLVQSKLLTSTTASLPAIVLFGSLLFPIAEGLGVHPVHYAMIAILGVGIGLFAPRFGVGYYTACAINRIAPEEGMRPIVSYMVALGIGLILVAAVPWISIGFL